MQTIVHFNSLPKAVRQRFIEATNDRGSPTPTLADRPMSAGMVWIALGLAAAAVLGVEWLWSEDLGLPYETPWGAGMLLVLAAIVFVAAWAAVTAVRRRVLAARLPFRPGVYLIGADLIEARTAQLRVVPLLACEPSIVHHHYNGAYVRTEFRFAPPLGKPFVFSVKPRDAAEAIVDELQRTLQLLAVVEQLGDPALRERLDLFHDLRDDHGRLSPPGRAPDPVPPLAGDTPGWLARPALVAAGLAVAVAAPIWHLRNVAHDDAAFADARASRQSWPVESYLRWGTRHRAEAIKLLEVNKLREAQDAGSVTALRDYLRNFPNAPAELREEARGSIHAHFTTALERFREIAGDPETLAFVERLIAHEEANDSPGLHVAFRPPRTESLAAMDEVLREVSEGRYDFAPLAPHFREDSAGVREAEIVRTLQRGFAQVFREDVLHLVHAGRHDGDRAADPRHATIDVAYEVRPMQDEDGPVIYLMDDRPLGYPDLPRPDADLPTDKRLYLGIEVDFLVTMRVPGHDGTRELTFTVQPPARFQVATDSRGNATDSSVYAIMSSRAFDELEGKLGGAFFRAAAHRGADVLP